MRSQLIVIHRPRQSGFDEGFTGLSANWVIWQTCIRRIAISLETLVRPEEVAPHASVDEIYKGAAATRFLLETVCGLNSPVRGETEVHGQFREVLENLGIQHSLYKTLQTIHLEARKVRTAHLRGLGSQSYGSFARRKVKAAKEIHMIGAGALGREILPWLAKLELPVHVHVRNAEKHGDLATKYPSVQVHDLEAGPRDINMEALVITAPVSASYLADWLTPRAQNIGTVLDYRGESHADPMPTLSAYFSLPDIFREIESTKQKVDAEVERAREMIQTLCRVG